MYTTQRKTPVILLCSIKGDVYMGNTGLVNEQTLRFVSTASTVKNQEWPHGSQQRCVELSPVPWTVAWGQSTAALNSLSPAAEAFLELHIVVSTAGMTGKKESKWLVYRNCPVEDYFVWYNKTRSHWFWVYCIWAMLSRAALAQFSQVSPDLCAHSCKC